MQASSPEASCTLLSSTLATSMAIRSFLDCRYALCGARPRQHLAAEHLFITLAAVDHGRVSVARGAKLRPQRRRRCLIDCKGVWAGSRHQCNAVIVASGRKRHFALDHVAL